MARAAATGPRIAILAMIRNEADILPDFLGHCAALCDEMLVVDHASTDGTGEMLAAAAGRMPLTVWRFPHLAKAQPQVCTALAQEAARRGADWILPLDADEFPLLEGRAALEAMLAGPPRMLAWTWRNGWPAAARFARCDVTGEHDSLRTQVPKVIIPAAFVADPRFALLRGGHAVRLSDPARQRPVRAGEVLHLPVRHADRLRLKLAQNLASRGVLAPLAATSGVQYRVAEARRDDLLAETGQELRRRFALGYPDLPEAAPARARPRAVQMLGRLEGLPAPLASVAEVLAREQALRWEAPPDPERQRWQVRLEPGVARLLQRPGGSPGGPSA